MLANPYNILILLGAVHGLVLSVLLLVAPKTRRPGSVLLAMLLIFYSLPLLRVILHDMQFYAVYGLPFGSIELLYGLGPALFLYAKSVTDPAFRMRGKTYLHFVPVVLEFLYYLSPFYARQPFGHIGAVQSAPHLLWMIEQAGAVVSVVIYLSLCNRLLWSYFRWVGDNFSDARQRALHWLRVPVVLYTVFFISWLGQRTADVLFFDDGLELRYYYPLLIFLSASTYWIGTKGFLEKQGAFPGLSASLVQPEPSKSDPPPEEKEVLAAIFREAALSLTRERLFLQNDLSLTQLAEHLGHNPRLLSRAINTQSEMNFYDFVNGYRIAEFKRRVAKPDGRKTLLELAFACGFGSKATFNHFFKKSTGLTPSQYRKQVRSLPSSADVSTS